MLTKKWVVLLILFNKGKAMIISTNIFTSLAKSPFKAQAIYTFVKS